MSTRRRPVRLPPPIPRPRSRRSPSRAERSASGDVEIQILYCGVCHSDLHQARNEWQNTIYPCVPGHEIVGRVTSVGANVTRFKAGELAGVGCLVGSCGVCDSCREGLEQYCEATPTFTYNSPDPHTGLTTYGGYSDRIVIDEAFTLRIPPRWNWRRSPRCSARGSRPTRRCATGTSARATRSALSASAASATWA